MAAYKLLFQGLSDAPLVIEGDLQKFCMARCSSWHQMGNQSVTCAWFSSFLHRSTDFWEKRKSLPMSALQCQYPANDV